MATDMGLTFSSQFQFLKQNIAPPFDMLVVTVQEKEHFMVECITVS